MIEDLATYLFILGIALMGGIYALLPARSSTLVRGRLVHYRKESDDLFVQVESVGRPAKRISVDPSGNFCCTVPSNKPVVVRVVHHGTVAHRIQVSPNTSARGIGLPLPSSVDLGDIVIESPEGLHDSSSVLLHPELITLSSSSLDQSRYAPLEHQLFDRADGWQFSEEVDIVRVGNRPFSRSSRPPR